MIQCLGVFKQENEAYQSCIDKLSQELENKNKTEHSKIIDSLNKLDEDQYKEKLEILEKALETIYGKNSGPKVWVESKPLQ